VLSLKTHFQRDFEVTIYKISDTLYLDPYIVVFIIVLSNYDIIRVCTWHQRVNAQNLLFIMVNSRTGFNLDDNAEKKSLYDVRKRFGVNNELIF
jgi:hypothetical protein